jgi:hypothetical protein
MLFSLVGAIFRALKAWAIWWCWDVIGRVLPGVEMGGMWLCTAKGTMALRLSMSYQRRHSFS